MGNISPERQNEIDVGIGILVLGEMCEEDTVADLSTELEAGEIRVSLRSDAQPLLVPSDELLEAVGYMVAMHESEDTGLVKAFYKYSKEESGDWVMVANFSYES